MEINKPVKIEQDLDLYNAALKLYLFHKAHLIKETPEGQLDLLRLRIHRKIDTWLEQQRRVDLYKNRPQPILPWLH
jgi:hypothetical protein